MNVIEKNQTQEIVDWSQDKEVVGCMWMYIVKYWSDDTLDLYKARSIAKRYTQTYDVD